ncbi:MAG: asparagine synthase (glutamine-hydrolyzing), partial [Planctomycetes bacterium]|nr:asparagine synthase (glutamine-hydrolyzing) [Planctomycetota bacterium]
MCGIAGIIRFSQRNMPGDSDLVWKMLGTLKHRGPDHAQVKALPAMTIGHTRLSIVDPSESSNQPLQSGDGRYWITFNGEIYNFLELRSELETAGRKFQTQSDTEVILAAYQQWGEESLHRFNGMWAFAIHDLQTGENFLARDRFGVKPLYYSQDGNRLLFASEMKALLAAGVAASPNFDVLRSQHSLASCDCSDRTIFSQIRALPAGHSLRIHKDRLQVTRWWNTLEQRIEVPRSRKERIRKFHDLLKDATRIRLRSDVGTAITLSGGMDSSAVYLFTKQITNSDGLFDVTTRRKKQPEIFSVTHPGQPTDESEYARLCLDQFGDEAHWLTISPDRFREQISEIIRSQESPVWSAAVFAYHEIYRKIAKANIRVVLEGHGSDEMLGGYHYLVNAALKTYAK